MRKLCAVGLPLGNSVGEPLRFFTSAVRGSTSRAALPRDDTIASARSQTYAGRIVVAFL